MNRLVAALLLLLVIAGPGQAQIKTTRLTKAELATTVTYRGRLVEALQWTDKAGQHLVVTAETDIQPASTENGEPADPDAKSKGLFAHHFVVTGGQPTQTWLVTDGQKACPLDLTARFAKNSLQVTDVNQDGTGEVWLVYKTACRGDVSPQTMKIIMYQGDQKFAMRGEEKLRVAPGPGGTQGGAYTFDYSFRSGPPAFRTFAAALWQKHMW